MPAGIVRHKGKWYVLITTYDVHHRGEAEELVAAKLEDKKTRCRVFPFASWGDAVVLGNNLTDEFLDDWSMREYVYVQPEGMRHKIERSSVRKMVETSIRKVERPEWKEKLKGVKGRPSVKVTIKKRRKL